MELGAGLRAIAFMLFAVVGCGGIAPLPDGAAAPQATVATSRPPQISSPGSPLATPRAVATAAATARSATAGPTAAPTRAPLPGVAPIGATETATVLSITDGDTIRVDRGQGSEPVRYIGIDTPEEGDEGADAATRANAALVEGREVVLETDVSDTDRFDRLLRYVWIEDGPAWLLVNLELVSEGYAEAVDYPPDVRYSELLSAAEVDARTSALGLWGVEPEDPDPPEDDDCHSSYDPCLPIVGDLNCPDVRALGLAPVKVIGPDDYRLDADHDGTGCD
jgi:micrococcal nuclease